MGSTPWWWTCPLLWLLITTTEIWKAAQQDGKKLLPIATLQVGTNKDISMDIYCGGLSWTWRYANRHAEWVIREKLNVLKCKSWVGNLFTRSKQTNKNEKNEGLCNEKDWWRSLNWEVNLITFLDPQEHKHEYIYFY